MSEQPENRRKRTIRAVERPREPWKTPDCDPGDVGALKAVYQGIATEHQQRRALDFIIKVLCAVGEQSYVPGGPPGATEMACGRRQVGIEIVNLVAVNLNPGGENA